MHADQDRSATPSVIRPIAHIRTAKSTRPSRPPLRGLGRRQAPRIASEPAIYAVTPQDVADKMINIALLKPHVAPEYRPPEEAEFIGGIERPGFRRVGV